MSPPNSKNHAHNGPSVAQEWRSTFRSPALVAALFCVATSSIDLTVIATILPDMVRDLGVNTADIDRYIWAVNGYLIAYVVAIPLVGRLSDLAGRKWIFLGCLTIFLVGSILCATAGSLGELIVGRTIQGLGGGGLLPVTIAMTGDIVPRRTYLLAVGVVSAVETLGWVVGPLYGAFIVELVPMATEAWRWVFWLNVPIVAVAMLAIIRGVPTLSRSGMARQIRRLDVLGAVLIAAALTSINLALASGGAVGSTPESGLMAFGGTPNPLAPYIPWLLGVTAICVIALVVWVRRVTLPIIPTALFRSPTYLATLVGNLLIGAVLMVGMVNVPVIVALVSDPGDVSRLSALLLAPLTLSIAIFSFASGAIARRMTPHRSTMLGVVLVALGYSLIFALLAEQRLETMVLGLLLAGSGIGLLLAPLSATALVTADKTERGAAASTALMCRLLGMTIGISSLTALGVWRLQRLTAQLDPVVQQADESTAEFLVRQQAFIVDDAIPLSVQVLQETFLLAAGLALVALVPVWFLRHANLEGSEFSSNSTSR